MERTLFEPELVIPDPDDEDVERRYRKIPENGDRVLCPACRGERAG